MWGCLKKLKKKYLGLEIPNEGNKGDNIYSKPVK